MNVLVINSGSSSLKYQLINSESGDLLTKGNIERIAEPNSSTPSHKHAVERVFRVLSTAALISRIQRS
jgi:acetate kinase